MRFRKAVYGALVAAAVIGSLWVPASTAGATSDPGAAADFVGRTNGLRASLGLPSLSVNGTLTAKAQQWAETMAAANNIFHSNLADGAPSEWVRLGENVGRGPSVDAIHNALVASPEHYRNLTDPGFRYVGVGVVNANGTIFVSEVFMESASQPAPSTSAPAAATTAGVDPAGRSSRCAHPRRLDARGAPAARSACPHPRSDLLAARFVPPLLSGS